MTMWPFRRHCSSPSDEATEALRQAERSLVDAEALDDAAKQVAERLDEIKERNHFRERAEEAMRRRPA